MFALFSVHGTKLCQDPASGKVVSRPNDDDRCLPVLLYQPQSPQKIAFLLTERSHSLKLRVDGDPLAYGIMPIRVQAGRELRRTAICLLGSGVILTCAPPGSTDPDGAVAFAREEVQEWEMFRLEPVDILTDYAALYPTLVALQQYAAQPLTAASILKQLEQGISLEQASAFDAVAQLLPIDQFSLLGATMLDSPAAIAALASAFPNDVFATTALPALQRWHSRRSIARHDTIGPDLDRLATLGIDDACTSFAHVCNAQARHRVQPRRAVSLVATARNEGIYLLEWVAYHRAIGVDGIFLYSNDNDDGSDEILRILSDAGVIVWIRSEVAVSTPAQAKAYGHAFGILPQTLDSRWTLIIDLDEFFAYDTTRFSSIADYMAWQEARPVDAVALNWIIFGSNGAAQWQDISLTRRFVMRMPWVDAHIKTIVRSNLALHARPHHPAYWNRRAVLTRNASGAVQRPGAEPSFSAHPEAEVAWINHYFLKSTQEFVAKFSRNRGDHPMRPGMHVQQIEENFMQMFAKQHGSSTLIEDRRIWACAPTLDEGIATLARLPGMPAALESVKRLSGQLMANLASELRRSAFGHNASAATRQLARLL